MSDGVLATHIAAGSIGLLLGPVLALLPKRRGRHTRLGDVYHWTFFVLFVTSVLLALLNWEEVWWLALVGVFSYSFALRGWLAAKRRRRGWIAAHVSGMGGSYIAMTTALLVVNWQGVTGASGLESLVPWLVPTMVGTPLIAYTIGEIARGRRPKAWRRERPAQSAAATSRA